MTLSSELGPLEHLAGTWEGDEGRDVAFSHERGEVIETPYRERTTFSPFGPVMNGDQELYGLDYRTSAWRGDEENPFHTEVGYWLWDARRSQVMRCFMVPRGTTVLAGGRAGPGDRSFTMEAELGSTTYGILSNRYLDEHARTTRYSVTITITPDGNTFNYEETTTLEFGDHGPVILHTDENTLRRVEG